MKRFFGKQHTAHIYPPLIHVVLRGTEVEAAIFLTISRTARLSKCWLWLVIHGS